jgi:hypothetical protein
MDGERVFWYRAPRKNPDVVDHMSQSKSVHDETRTMAWLGNFVLHAGPR